MEIKEFIKERLVEMHRTVSTDQYGQVSKYNFVPSLFGDRTLEVEQYCKENKGVLEYSAYGGTYGTYRAFTVQDVEIKKACYEALRENENYLRNVNSW